MNKAKWKDPSIPASILALKIAEEAGEVAREITDTFMKLGPVGNDSDLSDNILKELDQVIFISTVLSNRILQAKISHAS